LRDDDGDAVVDPPEGCSEADRFGMTAREEREGESLDDRLAEKSRMCPTTRPTRPMTVVPGALTGGRLTAALKTAARSTRWWTSS
jgi:hypothetical protein